MSESLSEKCLRCLDREGADPGAAVLRAAECPDYGRVCSLDDPGFNRAVEDVQAVAREYSEEVQFGILCEKMKGPLEAGDKDVFLEACREVFIMKSGKGDDGRVDSWLERWGRFFDKSSDVACLGQSEPFGFVCGYLLVVRSLGGKFYVSIERKNRGSVI